MVEPFTDVSGSPSALALDSPVLHVDRKLATRRTGLRDKGEEAHVILAGMGIRTVGDLLRHYPRRYIDRSAVERIGDLRLGEQATVIARVQKTVKRLDAPAAVDGDRDARGRERHAGPDVLQPAVGGRASTRRAWSSPSRGRSPGTGVGSSSRTRRPRSSVGTSATWSTRGGSRRSIGPPRASRPGPSVSSCSPRSSGCRRSRIRCPRICSTPRSSTISTPRCGASTSPRTRSSWRARSSA